MEPRSDTAIRTPPSAALPWIVAVAFFMQMLDGTILNTALPGMAAEMRVDPLRMQSVIIAYLLTTALVIPASGWLADRFGAKRIFVLAIFTFTLGSLLCAISSDLPAMVASRVVQGVGGALMVPVGRLIALRAYPRNEMVRVLSFITMPGLIGPLLGPTAGGFLVQYASWHWIFLINIPVGVVGGYLAMRLMPPAPEVEGLRRFDWPGFFLFGGAMVLISMAMEGLGELHLPKVQATLLCIAGLGMLGLYWLRAGNIVHALFPTGMFRIRAFSVGILGNIFSRLGSGAMPFLMPLYLQLGLGFSPFKAGMYMIPGAAAAIAGKSLITGLVRRFGFRDFLIVNTLALGGMICSLALVDVETSPVLLVCQLFVFGVFNSMQFTAMNTVTLIDLSDADTGAGNSILSVTMQISACCGVAMGAALLDGFMAGVDPGTGRGALSVAFSHTFLCVGVLSVITSAIFSQIPPGSGRGTVTDPIEPQDA